MKRVNISRDVVSRQKIATTSIQKEQQIVEPVKTEENYGKSEELQGGEDNTQDTQTVSTTQKRGRKTQGNP